MKKKYKYNGRKKFWIDGKQRHSGEIVELEGNEKIPWNLFIEIKSTAEPKPFIEPMTTEKLEKKKKKEVI